MSARSAPDTRAGRYRAVGELQHRKSLIAGYKSPRSVEFVDAMPMSGAGKILKRELRTQYWDNTDNQVSWNADRNPSGLRRRLRRSR
jgi:acyl-CoA synthetase (AMP-forming)/AMP-acid ligase II